VNRRSRGIDPPAFFAEATELQAARRMVLDESSMKPAVRDTLALLFASMVPLAMAWLGFVVLANDADRGQSLLAKVYAVGKVMQFSIPVLYVWRFERNQFRTMSFASRGVMIGLAFGILVDIGMAVVYVGVLRDSDWIADTPAKVFGKLQEFHLASPAGYLAIGLFLSVLHSFLEEYYWRWFVFGWLRRLVPVAWAIGLSSVGFMAHHVVILYVYFPGRFWLLAAPLSLGVAVGGAVWAWLYNRSGSLLGPWLSHALVDAGILLVGYDLLRGMWN
jgi:membrane protease YdiL (CAAX protease family)